MTKEELYEKAFNFGRKHSCESDVLEGYLDEFFEQNVVIPKGENRHPYADVLHEWIEGADLQIADDSTLQWRDYTLTAEEAHEGKYRIKPSEPVYEAVVRIHYAYGTYEDTQKYFTYEEFENFGFPKSCTWVESTRRERKQ